MRRWPAVVLAAALAVALGADLLASALPLAAAVEGQVYVLPSVFRPGALRGETHDSLRARGAWVLSSPVPFGPEQTVVSLPGERAPPASPDGRHWLGTDEQGRDVLARLLHGARGSLGLALGAATVAAVAGTLLGAAGGLLGAAGEAAVALVVGALSSIPALFLLLLAFSALEERPVWLLALALGVARCGALARVVQAEVAALRRGGVLEAARGLGAGFGWNLRVHVLPAVWAPVRAGMSWLVASSLVVEVSLTYLGLGLPVLTPSWGELLAQASRTLLYPGAWWLALAPGVALGAVVLAAQALGEDLDARAALGERLDPPP